MSVANSSVDFKKEKPNPQQATQLPVADQKKMHHSNSNCQFLWRFQNKIRIGNWQLSCQFPIQMLILNRNLFLTAKLLKQGYTRGIWKILSMASELHNALIKCYQIIHFCKLEFNGYLMVLLLSKRDSACTCSECWKRVGFRHWLKF